MPALDTVTAVDSYAVLQHIVLLCIVYYRVLCTTFTDVYTFLLAGVTAVAGSANTLVAADSVDTELCVLAVDRLAQALVHI